MENIFFDTSEIIAGNYFESTKLKELLKLANDGHLQILMPEITHNEVQKHAEKDLNKAIQENKKHKEDSRILRNVPSIEEDFKLYNKREIKEEFFDAFQNKLKKAKIVMLPYPTTGVKEIFQKYFDNEAPFDKETKKHEFPDAFALRSVEEWCEHNKAKCIVLSKDKDMTMYKSDHLEIRKLGEFVDEKVRQVGEAMLLKQAANAYQSESLQLQKDIEKWVTDQIDDYRTFASYVNNYDIHNVEIVNLKVDLLGYKFTSVTKDSITFHAEAKIIIHVEVEVDDENYGYYDNEEKEWIALDTRKATIDDTFIVPIELLAYRPEAGDEDMEIEINEINHNRPLDFPDDSHMY